MIKNNIEIKNLSKIRITIGNVFDKVYLFADEFSKKIHSLSISFVPDKEMIELNEKYLSHEGTTDIITFDYSEIVSDNIEGEIIICADQAKKQASEYKVKLENELTRLIFHGLLHIAGYNDNTDDEKKIMTEKENLLLDLWYKDQVRSV